MQFHVRLLLRTTRKVSLTKAGYQHTQKILLSIDYMVDDMDSQLDVLQ
ncbi:LysR family transcriptional regulator [Psychromonas sp. SP041]|nr:LysR family transcriptional regulator [Psychromonas sp. SP041]